MGALRLTALGMLAAASVLAGTMLAMTVSPFGLLGPVVAGANPVGEHFTMNAKDAQSTPTYSKSGHDLTPPTPEEKGRLLEGLTEEQIRITQEHGTEPAFCGTLLDNKKEGVYACVVCGLPLFQSSAKFDSGSGWPSFYRPADPQHIKNVEDRSFGMLRVETRCQRCDAHLGHVFDDGPPPTGLRYCLNGAALGFFEKGAELPERSQPIQTETAYFAGGCFWGVEDAFQQLDGVLDAVSGYQGGHVDNPTYKQVCYTDTGHAESVKVVFDPKRISYRDLLAFFFKIHDPTTVNRQGPDVGSQYRSAIFTTSPEQTKAAKERIAELREKNAFGSREIVTQVVEDETFYEAEEYHQDYHLKHGGSCAIPR